MESGFRDYARSTTSPADRAIAVVPADNQPLPFLPRAIYVGTGGDLVMTGANGQSVSWKNVPAGVILPFRASIVHATGTTAANLLALD